MDLQYAIIKPNLTSYLDISDLNKCCNAYVFIYGILVAQFRFDSSYNPKTKKLITFFLIVTKILDCFVEFFRFLKYSLNILYLFLHPKQAFHYC